MSAVANKENVPGATAEDELLEPLTDREENLVMLVRRLSMSLAARHPTHKLPKQALDYLKRSGLLAAGQILR